MQLTAQLVENFAGVFLSQGYDDPQPTPAFHPECWALYCSPVRLAAVAAPRGHAKSTALTHDFGLAALCFRFSKHMMIVSSTEELAMIQLGDMARELRENEDLRREFGIVKLEVDSKAEIIVLCDDGYRFRVIARGVEQRVRGMKWDGQRPDLILMDDVEEDEQVGSPERRKKLSRWVNRALIPAGSLGARIRWHGTLLHGEAMLARIMKAKKSWKSLFYKAHESFDDFSNQLWPERIDRTTGRNNEQILRDIRQQFIDDGDVAGYCQELLNDPRDDEIAYIQKGWFDPMDEEDHKAPGIKGMAIDFAVSKKDSANRTSITIGKMCSRNLLHFIDQRVGRWDSEEIVQEIFDAHERHRPDTVWVEGGQIWLAVWPMIKTKMQERRFGGTWINFVVRQPIKDKAARGKSLQRRMKCGGTRWDTEAAWFPGMQTELLSFSETADAQLDDQFDSAALLSLGFETMAEIEDEDLMSEEEEEFLASDPNRFAGRNATTGY